MKFTKMHGLGNDYVYVNCFDQKVRTPAKLAQIISDRHFGIGSDGLILICPSKKADVRMRIFNADGSEAEMCGNGVRCVAKYAYEHKLVKAGGKFSIPGQKPYPCSLKVETGRGILMVGLVVNKADKVQKVCVDMGEPILQAKDVPVNLPAEKIIDQPMQFENRAFIMTCVSMGNPHAVFFRKDIGLGDIEKFGPVIENHSIFPNRTNVHFVQVENRGEFTMRTWERGSGVTLACGTGACASFVAAVITNRCDPQCVAHLPGGDLELNFCRDDYHVYMAGPAVQVFEGCWPEK